MHRAILLLTMPRETGGGVKYKLIYFSSRNWYLLIIISFVFCRTVIAVLKSFDHSNEPVTSFPSK